MRDNISDMLTRIRNGQKANLIEIPLFWPTPKICLNILNLLNREGYIRGIKKKLINEKVHFFVLLKYTSTQTPTIKKIERISKPGKRVFCQAKNLWKINNGMGCFILSTPLGLITDNFARKNNVGGEVLCYIE